MVPAISKESSGFARGLHFTLVDIVGALFPGLVWFILLITLAHKDRSPFESATWLLSVGDDKWALYITVGFSSILLGWVVKVTGLDLADWLCAFVIRCGLWLRPGSPIRRATIKNLRFSV